MAGRGIELPLTAGAHDQAVKTHVQATENRAVQSRCTHFRGIAKCDQRTKHPNTDTLPFDRPISRACAHISL